MCYCNPNIRTPCCGASCHEFLGEQAAPCPWHENGGSWKDKPRGELIDDISTMIKLLQEDRTRGACTLHLPDEQIRHMGGDPDDYPSLPGYPGWRIVEVK